MRVGNGGRNGNRRLIGQLSKAMDRSGDAVLHRVRSQQGTERINMHNRQPPKGPRSDQGRLQRPQLNGRQIGMQNGVVPNGGPGLAGMPMTPQQQMQLFAMYEEQARVMSQIFSPQHQQIFLPGTPQPAFNPTFQNGLLPQPPQAGRSLFDRVEGTPQRQNGSFGRRPQQNGGHGGTNGAIAPQMGTALNPHQTPTNNDISSPMEVESSQTNQLGLSPDTICKFNLLCTKKDCPFAHQASAAPPGITIDVSDHCPFGAACKNRKCVARHPSPAQKATHQFEQDCKFFPNCTNLSCPFRHPTMPMCRNGADCKREGCKFTHVKVMCKFNPCLNAACPYKHIEGQKRGVFDDKVWVADGAQEKGHVSERKFVDDETLEEELIVPENPAHASQPSSVGAEVVT
jgi:nuclear polyadenylated RNA-binding protein NAB2